MLLFNSTFSSIDLLWWSVFIDGGLRARKIAQLLAVKLVVNEDSTSTHQPYVQDSNLQPQCQQAIDTEDKLPRH